MAFAQNIGYNSRSYAPNNEIQINMGELTSIECYSDPELSEDSSGRFASFILRRFEPSIISLRKERTKAGESEV